MPAKSASTVSNAKSNGINREHGADLDRTNAVAAPATVSGSPSILEMPDGYLATVS